MREDILPAAGSDFGETDGHSQERNATGGHASKSQMPDIFDVLPAHS
ncbi:hypothetical protein [uncultured Martelella sp.]|nr:hypothetical protein [uncultured Martelella sp.]